MGLPLQQRAGCAADSGWLARARGWESGAAVPPLCRLPEGRSQGQGAFRGPARLNDRAQSCGIMRHTRVRRGWQARLRTTGWQKRRWNWWRRWLQRGGFGKPYPCVAIRRGPVASAKAAGSEHRRRRLRSRSWRRDSWANSWHSGGRRRTGDGGASSHASASSSLRRRAAGAGRAVGKWHFHTQGMLRKRIRPRM